jgi:quinol monooxygenase YgiN
MIAVIGHLDVDPAHRDELVAASTDLQRAVRDEPGCLVYVFAPDPTDPGRIGITELWESADALDAHFVHPNFAAARALFGTRPRLGGSGMKYRIDAAAPVRDAEGNPSVEFPPG